MRTFRGNRLCVWAFVFLTATITLVRASDTNPPPRLTVELRDGSRVVGTSVEKYFRFHSALLGNLKLNVTDIRSIDCVSTNATKLSTANGDSLTVSFVDSEIAVKTSFGKVALAANSIRQVTVSATRLLNRVREGLVGVWFDNSDDTGSVIVVSNSAALVSMQQTRQLSIEVWIKPNSIPHEFPMILGKGSSTQSGHNFGGYEFVLNGNGDNDLVFISGGYLIDTFNANGHWINNHLGEWIHVAFTLNDQTKTAKFYVNGQPTNDEKVFGTAEDLNFDVPSDLYIGTRDPANTPNIANFDGTMKDLRLFNRALTATEIREDYETGHPN